MSRLARERFVRLMISFANGKPWPFPAGLITDGPGEPIARLTSDSGSEQPEVRQLARTMFSAMATDDDSAVDGLLNYSGTIPHCVLTERSSGQCALVPVAATPCELVRIAAIVARTTVAGPGRLSERIGHCQCCGSLYVRRTRRTQRFCKTSCRVKSWRASRTV